MFILVDCEIREAVVNCVLLYLGLFFFTDPAATEIYTLSLHDALPICCRAEEGSEAPASSRCRSRSRATARAPRRSASRRRSEEHTSELQSHSDLVCRLLLEKKKKRSDLRTYCALLFALSDIAHAICNA